MSVVEFPEELLAHSLLLPREDILTNYFYLFFSSKCLSRTVESLRRCPKCQLSLQPADIFPNYTRKISISLKLPSPFSEHENQNLFYRSTKENKTGF